jgi:1-acyl-sn-glycerol-3-phosphate acyltransferase
MSDAKVIPMDGDRPRTPGARSVLAGADRASGERVVRRRRTTPLLSDRDDAVLKGGAEEKPPLPTKTPAAVEKPAKKAAAGKKSKKTAAAKRQTVTPAVVERTDVAFDAESAAAGAVDSSNSDPGKSNKSRDESSPAEANSAEANSAEANSAEANSAEAYSADPSAADLVDAEPDQARPDDHSTPRNQRSIAQDLINQAGAALLEALTSRARPAEIEAKVASVLSFLARRLSGDYELDDFGFDPEFAEAIPLTLLRPLYKHWFRVEVRGIENLPLSGGALIVANHSGAVPIDALMTSVAVHEEHPEHRFLRTLGADLLFQTPFLAGIARRGGATLASNPDAERLLSEGHLVGVWPEGFKGIGKPFTERYKLQRFGRGGFVSAALRTGTPIVPCSIVGAEETYPIIGNVPSLARLLGLPYLPITPFFPLLGPLGMIPLPSKWLIEFGTPVLTQDYDPSAAEDPMLVFDLTDQIRQSIQQTLYSLLVQRRSIFF